VAITIASAGGAPGIVPIAGLMLSTRWPSTSLMSRSSQWSGPRSAIRSFFPARNSFDSAGRS
jgi:hypothetical protein